MRLSFAVGAVTSLAVACGSSVKQGGERQDCYPNGTCNMGLVCLSNTCVSLGDGGGGSGGGGGTMGGGGTGGGGGSAACLTAANHGALGALTGPAAVLTDTTYIDWTLALEPGTPRDEFNIQLFSGLGVFASGFRTGTFTLSGDDLNYGTCGLCVLIYENIDAQTAYRGVYLATSGTVTLTSVSGTLAGGASNLKFQHVNIDQNTSVSTPDGDGCRSAIDSVGFDVPIN